MSLLATPSVCFNSTDFLESICNNHGTCANETNAECVCDGEYVKETYCLTTISEELNYANFPLYVMIAIAFGILILLTAYDFIIDLRLKAWPSIKRPIAIGKITMFLATIAIFVHAVIDYMAHSENTHQYHDLISVLGFFSDLLTLMTYSIATLSWISVILLAKGLGKKVKGLSAYRIYVLVANCVLLPLYLLSGVLRLVIKSEFILAESTVIGVAVFVFYLTLIIGTSVFIRKSFVWIRSLEISRRTATTDRVQMKTYFLIAANAVASVRYVMWMVAIFSGTTTARFHLYRQILNLSLAVFFVFLLLILENHVIRLPLYIRTGEIRSNTFLGGSGSNSTRPATTTQSKPSSRKFKSTTDSTRDASSVAQAELVASRAPSSSGEEEEEPEVQASLGLSSSDPPSSSGSSSGYYSTSSLRTMSFTSSESESV